MKKGDALKKLLLSLYHYVCFFLVAAFLISCCMMLFLNVMSENMGIVLSEKDIKTAAVTTFINVIFLSAVFTAIDAIRRRFTVDRPVKKIVAAAEQIAKGDYSVRIPPLRSCSRADGLDEIIDCYNKMARELAGIETLQTDFIANVSHELKSPLAVIQNYGTLLQQPDLPEADRIQYAKAVSEASRRLAELITNILKLDKLENQQIYPAEKIYDLGEQLCQCLLTFENVWENKDISIETDIQEDVQICADPELICLVWNNLFSNAFKFTEPGGRVTVSLKTEDKFAVVRVEDTGCGIPAEVGKHIFEKFYQGDTSHASQGNGLGLALVRRVVDIMGGEISVASQVGVGTAFAVKFRRAEHE